jgi:hypothetical protein
VEVAPGTSLRDWIRDDLTREAMQVKMRRLVDDQRVRLVSYLDGVFKEHRVVATLDIGFYGQIQASIDAALDGERRRVTTTHLLGFGHGPVRDHVLDGRDVRTFAGGYGSDAALVRTIHRSAPVLEQLLQGPEGTTTGYVVDQGISAAVCENNPLPVRDLARKALVQAGVFAYQDLWLELRRSHPALVARLVDRRGAWCRLVHRLIEVPSHTEATTLGSLSDDLNFGTRAVLPFCPPAVEAQIGWIGARTSYQRGAGSLQAIWPQGAITRVDSGAIVLGHAQAAHAPYIAAALGLAHTIRSRGVTRVVGYGSGDVALAFLDAAAIVGLEVTALVDSNPVVHGQRLHDIEVCSLDAAIALDVHVYAVLSIAHAAPITDTIRRRYGSEAVSPLILDIASSASLP